MLPSHAPILVSHFTRAVPVASASDTRTLTRKTSTRTMLVLAVRRAHQAGRRQPCPPVLPSPPVAVMCGLALQVFMARHCSVAKYRTVPHQRQETMSALIYLKNQRSGMRTADRHARPIVAAPTGDPPTVHLTQKTMMMRRRGTVETKTMKSRIRWSLTMTMMMSRARTLRTRKRSLKHS